MMDKNTVNWQNQPFWIKCWFFLDRYPFFRTTRAAAKRVEVVSHISGFIFCTLGLVNQAALGGGLIMLANAYFFYLSLWLGDKYGIWYESQEGKST